MLAALLLSFAVIFVAELGDKSQLMAMTFALRYRWWVVLIGITAATTAVHLISVGVGHYLGAALPTHLLGILAGVAFVFFGLWTLRGDKLTDDEATRAERSTAPAFFTVTSAFLLAELGDKTMLATITLAADNDWVGVWIGSTIGMVAADALAILVGALAGKHLPERAIQLGAAALFAIFGISILLEGAFPAAPVVLTTAGAIAVTALCGAGLRALPAHLRPAAMRKPAPADPAKTDQPGAIAP
ncbi:MULTISPECIES: TMEM165/GDT1 family protein [unclassified Mycolicibacterium]|uniref:TMEM165/GDT1 family protein n=1 Tax=unclassified Mycolicibacterium TaxID=2636767 RepID=UPI00130BE0D9|nr:MULTISPECIES: TMEM165/GDT1 family protein [unclassified Mycolicibacterium]MUL82765.1 TMEM165/GDT1 family protein [Mycolicibacterium sp. CBMA 329]MUL89100.1 TMEM165/GDT1 family protein [Mycolicibacterium sp. CBMA 331]MUL97667.1 TMEM165/GDT1 family protein [Mycolicibacterium sp. CBMA 334]MUM28659.1 TMEM165/GDT1 family protein [Mycolicibacterium sp. CBMA 295]MUM38616.1 TMEM165/GDT1 family protein [Mycolicibacterium sp. CBMA 247]